MLQRGSLLGSWREIHLRVSGFDGCNMPFGQLNKNEESKGKICTGCTDGNETSCCEWECPHKVQATSNMHANSRARVQCELGPCKISNKLVRITS